MNLSIFGSKCITELEWLINRKYSIKKFQLKLISKFIQTFKDRNKRIQYFRKKQKK